LAFPSALTRSRTEAERDVDGPNRGRRAMNLNSIPLFALLQSKLGYTGARQDMIAQNVANASTPGYTPQDLKPFSAEPGLTPAVNLPATPPSGLAQGAGAAMSVQLAAAAKQERYATIDAPDSEATLDGNSVVLEEQMIKLNDAAGDYENAIAFYQKALGLLHLAVRKPGA
jgi:flagellar basal-body rod protein FlgB